MKRETFTDLDQRARAYEGLDLLACGLACQALSLRGSCYPDSTERPAVEEAVRDLTSAHFLATCSIPLWLRSCKRCKSSKPADKEFCDPCQEREWDEERQWRGEEQDRKRFEHMASL